MTYRAYLMPMVVKTIFGSKTGRVPKYNDVAGQWSIVDLGDIGDDHCVFVGDVTDPEHATIAGDPDCVAVPLNIDGQVGGALSAVQAALEARNIPSGWVTSGMTYRKVLRSIIGVALLLQRMSGIVTLPEGKLFSSGTLERTIGSLSATYRSALIQAGSDLGIDSTGINLSSTIREVLTRAAQWGGEGQFPVIGQL